MQKTFHSVEDAVGFLDVSATHTKIKNARGVVWMTMEGERLEDAKQNADALLHFIESYELKRELERQLGEKGVIELRADEGYYGAVAAVAELMKSALARK